MQSQVTTYRTSHYLTNLYTHHFAVWGNSGTAYNTILKRNINIRSAVGFKLSFFVNASGLSLAKAKGRKAERPL